MIIKYKNKKLMKLCQDEKKLIKEYNLDVSNKIILMIQLIEASVCFKDIKNYPPAHLHPLRGKRNHEFSIDLGRKAGFRLIIVPLDKKEQVIKEKDIEKINTVCIMIRIEEVSNHYE